MRRRLAPVWLGMALATSGLAAEGECELVSSLGTSVLPGGVAWDGTALWVADTFAPTLLRLDPASGAVLATIPSPGVFVGGLAWDGSALWCAPEQTGMLYRLDPTDGTVLASVPASTFGQRDPNGSGLAWDGTALWHADYGRRRLVRLDPADGSVLAELPSPGRQPMGLSWYAGLLVVADAYSDDVSLVDTSDGTVVAVCAAPDTDVRGLAVDADGMAWSAGWRARGVHCQQLPGVTTWFETVCSAAPSSLGEPAGMSAEGSPSVSAADLTLRVGPVPDDFCMLLGSTERGERPFHGAVLCVAPPVRVLAVGRARGGELVVGPDARSAKRAWRFEAGETWTFQAVYRDRGRHGPGRFGLSEALAVTFEP